MLNFSWRVAILCLVIPLFMLVQMAPAETGQAPAKNEFAVSRLRQFLVIFYPSLFGNTYQMKISSTQPLDGSWDQIYDIDFQVQSHQPFSVTSNRDKRVENIHSPSAQILQGFMHVGTKGVLEQISVEGGDIVESKRNSEIRKIVEKHPEWSATQALEALDQAGAQYGPARRNEFLQIVPWSGIEAFFGHINSKSVEFFSLAPRHEGYFVLLYWVLHIQTENAQNESESYDLVFEPFTGKLIAVNRR